MQLYLCREDKKTMLMSHTGLYQGEGGGETKRNGSFLKVIVITAHRAQGVFVC